jgi:hypothetical protein
LTGRLHNGSGVRECAAAAGAWLAEGDGFDPVIMEG